MQNNEGNAGIIAEEEHYGAGADGQLGHDGGDSGVYEQMQEQQQ